MLLLRIGRDVELADDVVHRDAVRAASCAVKSSVSIRAPFFLRTCLNEVLRLLVSRRSGPALAEAGDLRRVRIRLLRALNASCSEAAGAP